MKKSKLLLLFAGLFLLSTSPIGLALQQAKKTSPAKSEEILTNDSVIQLLQAGIGEDVIISKIQKSRCRFDLSTQGMVALKEGGVSNNLLRFLIDVQNPAQATPKSTAAKEVAAPAVAAKPVTTETAKEPRDNTIPAADRAKSGTARFTISGYVGASSTSAAPRVNVVLYSEEDGKNVDSVQTNFLGKYTFKDVAPGTYLVKVAKISKEAVVVKGNLRIDIDLSAKDGTMDYSRSAAAAPASSGTASPAQAPGPNDSSLMQAMAAEYYSYSGSTERKVMLCQDGRYFNASESSYSGTSSDSLGNQNMAWGSAGQRRGEGRWTVQGNQQQGTISLRESDGSQSQVRYESTGERGCFRFNGNTFCVSGPPRCQ